MSNQFRTKPVVVEAFQMTQQRRCDNVDWPEWLNRAWNLDPREPGAVYPTVAGTPDGTLSIQTLESEHMVSWGDWIIRGVKGELYQYAPDIFEATYEPVNETYPPVMDTAKEFDLIREYRVLVSDLRYLQTLFEFVVHTGKSPERWLREQDPNIDTLDSNLTRHNALFLTGHKADTNTGVE